MVDLLKIPMVILSSDLPESFSGKVLEIEEKSTKEGGSSINLTVEITETKAIPIMIEGKQEMVNVKGRKTNIMYRIPKARTGRGQGDLLLKYLRGLGFTDTQKLMNNEYIFERHSLTEIDPNFPFAKTENPRHYPIKLVQ